MATFHGSVAGGGTTGTGNRTVTITSAAPFSIGDLFIVFVTATGNASQSSWSVSDDNSGTYTRINGALLNTSADGIAVFVRDTLMVNTTSTVVTANTGSNTAAEIVVVAVSGMTKVSAAAVRQSAVQANQVAGGTPAPVFGSAALTANMVLGAIGNGTVAGSVCAPPSGWTERQDVAQSSPTCGLEVATRDSGETGTTITFGSTSPTAFGSVIIELSTISIPIITNQYRQRRI